MRLDRNEEMFICVISYVDDDDEVEKSVIAVRTCGPWPVECNLHIRRHDAKHTQLSPVEYSFPFMATDVSIANLLPLRSDHVPGGDHGRQNNRGGSDT